MARFEVLDHTADTGISATADTLENLVEVMARGMFSIMAVVTPCPADHTVDFEVSATNGEDLLYECLSELLYLSEVEDLMFCDFEIRSIGRHALGVRASGAPVGQVEVTGPPIKAVTYHDIEVVESGDVWHGRVYFDV